MSRVHFAALCLSHVLAPLGVAGGSSEACPLGADHASCLASSVARRAAAPRRGVSSDHVMIQVRSVANQSSSTSAASSGSAAPCCSRCGPSRPFCSPGSGNCYRTKRKDYYESCPAAAPCVGEDCPLGWAHKDAAIRGVGHWCEVAEPSADWSPLKTCPTGNGTVAVKVLTYNLYWWNLFGRRHGEGGRAGRKIATTSGPEEYDLLGFQECDDIGRVMGDARSHGLSGDYGTLNGGRALGMAYLKSRWTLLDSGREDVGEDSYKQYYGKRSAQWARLRHKADGATVFFMNHHGPLPVSEGGGCTGSATAYNMMRVIAENAHAGDTTILVGDFNAAPHSSRVQALSRHMHRVFTGSAHGGVDHIFSNCEGSAVASTKNIGSGGSDHDALNAVFRIPATGKSPDSPDQWKTTTTSAPPVTSSTPSMAACCAACGGVGFCSPVSGNCYHHKHKHYYETCSISA